MKILLLAELDSTELTERVEAQKIETESLAEGNAQNLKKSIKIITYKCILSFFAKRVASSSLLSSSGTQQSTGHTAAHCGSS